MVPFNSNGPDETLICNHKINEKLPLLKIWDADLVKGSFLEEVTAKLRYGGLGTSGEERREEYYPERGRSRKGAVTGRAWMVKGLGSQRGGAQGTGSMGGGGRTRLEVEGGSDMQRL